MEETDIVIRQWSQALLHPPVRVLVGEHDDRNKESDNYQKNPISNLSAVLYSTNFVRVRLVKKGRLTYFGIKPASRAPITIIILMKGVPL